MKILGLRLHIILVFQENVIAIATELIEVTEYKTPVAVIVIRLTINEGKMFHTKEWVVSYVIPKFKQWDRESSRYFLKQSRAAWKY